MPSFQVEADEVDHLYEKAAEKYYELYRDTEFNQKTENWITTIKRFQLIYRTFPDHPQAPKSLFNVGKLYRSLYQWNQKNIYLDRSNIAFRKIVRQYPESSLADDAQFLLGENYERFRKDDDLAQMEYKKVLELYPKGTAAEKARGKLAKYRTNQEVSIEPSSFQASSPDDLTKPRFGGLSELESTSNPSFMVSKVDYWSTPNWSRMVINVEDEVRYKYQLLNEDSSHPHKRLYIDLLNTYIPSDFKRTIAAKDGLISRARIAQFDPTTVRIVLDIQTLHRVKIFHFQLPNQYKIVVDMLGESQLDTVTEASRQQALSFERPPDKPEDESVTLSKALGLKVKTIIIDPGHGGKDPGAIAYKTQEKDVVLDIANHLKSLINEHYPDIKTLMTRSTDRFIELEARTAFANQEKGDLFISIHANASLNKKLSGIETYYLNLTTDSDALSLAAKENKTNLQSISALQTILNDLMVNSKIEESRDLAEIIQRSLVDATGQSKYRMKDLGVKQAPFAVLIGAQMPAILVETGFLSNSIENRFLRDVNYKKTIAAGIFRGIENYMN